LASGIDYGFLKNSRLVRLETAATKGTKSPYGDWLVQLESAPADSPAPPSVRVVPCIAATLVAGADFEKAILH